MTHFPIASTESKILIPERKRIAKYLRALLVGADFTRAVNTILSEENQHQGADILRRLTFLLKDHPTYSQKLLSQISSEQIAALFASKNLKLTDFINLKLLPTPAIFQHLLSGDIISLEEQMKSIKEGGFDKNNPLHIELEYSKWVMKGDQVNFSWEAFTELLGEKQNEIRNIVADNEEIRNFIEAEAKKGKVLVLFNSRYGTDYVGVFLQEDLVKNPNIVTTNISVRSTEYDSEEEFIKRKFHSVFSNSTLDYLDQEHDTVIVIDGTRFNDHQGKKKRFPAATTKIVWELIKNSEHNLRFWIPNTGEVPHSEVMLGWWCDPQEFPLSQGKKDLIVVRATGRSQGLFDDPEDCTFLSYTPTGVKVTPLARSKNRLNMEIKEEAERKI